MIQSNVYGKSAQNRIGFISWKRNGISKTVLIESNVNTIESSNELYNLENIPNQKYNIDWEHK